MKKKAKTYEIKLQGWKATVALMAAALFASYTIVSIVLDITQMFIN